MFFFVDTLGIGSVKLYIEISKTMEDEFNKKYYANMDSYGGLTGIIKKRLTTIKLIILMYIKY